MTAPLTQFNRDHAIKLYIGGMSALMVAREIGAHPDWVTDLVSRAGVARSRSEAAKLKFARGYIHPQRIRLPDHEIVRRYRNGESTNGIAATLGISSRPVIQRLQENGVALRSPAEAAMLLDREKTGAVRAESYPSLIGWGEETVARWLEERGERPERQHPVGTRNIDLAIEPIAVEVWLSCTSPSRDPYCLRRMEYLADRGWWSYYVWVMKRTRVLLPCVADEVIAFVQKARRNPSPPREYRVIRGCGELAARAGRDLNDWSFIRPSVHCPHHSCINKSLR